MEASICAPAEANAAAAWAETSSAPRAPARSPTSPPSHQLPRHRARYRSLARQCRQRRRRVTFHPFADFFSWYLPSSR
ncbi:hypothetical protein BZL30_3915 [Mycobacterium kansasii]|uniref:Uncharacterized protein n=1 Tax=Mycobacterium kansasii TaxID=1768 RepID=A0A1V3XA56_MYCKA|nr:hypothetical protein BZL30_3915 [Mycobacterium kansasii]